MTCQYWRGRAALAAAVLGLPSLAIASAADNASDPAYASDPNGAWLGQNPTATENPVGSDNGGSGFGIWNFADGYYDNTLSPYGRLNHFIDGVDFPHSSYNNLGAPAFGLTQANFPAGNGGTTNAQRPFAQPLQVGETFSVNFDSPSVYDSPANSEYPYAIIEFRDASDTKTFSIAAGSNRQFGDFNWAYDHAGGTDVDTGIAPTATSDGSSLSFQLTSANAGVLTFDGQPFNLTLLAGAPASVVFSVYETRSGNGGSVANGQREFFFNNLSIVTPITNSTWLKDDSSSSWSTSSSWSGGVPSVAGAIANFGSVITAARLVNVDAAETVGTINFNNANSYTLAGQPVTIDTTGANGLIHVIAGTHQINCSLVLNKNTTFTVDPAAATLTASNLTATGRNVTKDGAGTLQLNRMVGNALAVNAGTVKIIRAANPNDASSNSGVSRVVTLSVANGAHLDLTNNKLVTRDAIGSLSGSTYSGVQGMVQKGRNGGSWNGSGIISSQSNALIGLTSIGVATGAQVRPATATATALWAGQTITGTDTLVMYTYGGDATLDGKINIDDYVKIDQGIAGGLSGWTNGDFNYDGKVNIDDYTTVIDSNIGAQGPPIYTSSGVERVEGVVSVPEPVAGVFGAVSCVLPGLLRRRRTLS